MKHRLKDIVLSLTLLILIGCRSETADYEYAKVSAQDEFDSACKNLALNPADFEGPIDSTVGGAPFAFDWKKKGSDCTIIVSVSKWGNAEASFLGDCGKLKGVRN